MSNAPKPSLVGLLSSIVFQSGAGFGSGWALSAQNPAGVTMFTIIASLVLAFDFSGYVSGADLTRRTMWTLVTALIMTTAALVPYFAMSRGAKGNKNVGTSAVPVAAGAWMMVALVAGGLAAKGGSGIAGPMQGMIVSLMYMSLASFMGYSMNAAKKDPTARGSTLFALAIYVLLFAFDMAGFSQIKGANAPAAASNSANKVNAPAPAAAAANQVTGEAVSMAASNSATQGA